MGRIVALDVGRKRTGIAVSDTLHISANSLATCATGGLMDFLQAYAAHEPIDTLVVGEPRTEHGAPSEAMVYVRQVVTQLKKRFPDIPVVLHDERYTSRLAQRTILEAGIPKMKRRDKALVDRVSATILLQSYMEMQDIRKA